MRGKITSSFLSATCVVLLVSANAAFAQSVPGYDPFHDEEDLDAPAPVYNGLADAAANLFGPSQYAAPQPQIAPPWQDLNAVDPNGTFSSGYSDTSNERVKRIVEAPLEKKKPFSDPLEDFAKDKGAAALFDKRGERDLDN